MAKPGGGKKGKSTSGNAGQGKGGQETISGYFRKVFADDPRLLDSRSNNELLARWVADHPDTKEAPERVRQNLSNIKSILRKQGRRRGRRKQQQEQAASGTPLPPKVRHAGRSLEALEEHIDEALTVAKVIDREGLAGVIQLLRRARNEVVWKMGQ